MKLGSAGLAFATSGIFFLHVLAQSSSSTNSASAAQAQATLPVGSCTADIPCSNGACCNSKSGYCGYGADFCTTLADGGPCTSNCDAKAQCGPNAPAGEEQCPLNVCCSQYGFCGTTDEFCGTGCASNCNPPPLASCGAEQASALTRRIGYYEGWAGARPCQAWPPSSINVDSLTHLNFAFAYISSAFEVIEMTPGDSKLWSETTALKSVNPSLKVFLSIGGWTFNDPPTQGIFSALAASSSNTNTFIKSVLKIMAAYSFDGIDIDWEYPVAEDRGGSTGDTENYVSLLKAIKSAFSPYNYGLSFTAPSSYWYLQNYDLLGMLGDDAADWVNVMTYDLHGVWDSPLDYIGSIVLPHTNLTEIMLTMQLYANVGVDPSKMNLGIGFYGRSFQLVSNTCTDPGCLFAGAAPGGPCSGNAGTLMFSEIENIVASTGSDQLVFDEAAAVKYLVYNDIDWVSYDDQQTLSMKLQYANDICLGGTMVWSLDQDDSLYTALSALWGDVTANEAPSSVSGNRCIYTECGLSCPKDYTLIGGLQKNPRTLEVCTGLKTSSVCCPVGDTPQSCTWRGFGPIGVCDGTCLQGEVLMGLSEVGDKTGSSTVDGVTSPELSCLIGKLSLCCKTDEDVEADCSATACGVTTCPSGFTAMTNVLAGAEPLDLCTSGLERTLCCESDIGLTNCNWYGTIPNCFDNACPVGQTVIYTDYQGDANSSCVGGNQRNYCCDTPNASTFSPVPVDDVFPESETIGDAVTFTVDYDDNEGTPDDTTTGDGSSGLSDDGKENDSPFSSVFISSPNAASVSSLDLASDWVVTDCDATSDQPQSVLAYCTCPMDDEDCGCAHVFIGHATDTIVKMPTTCGLGPYARVVSLEVHPDQTVLSTEHGVRKRSTDPVYWLVFDYAFTDISEDNGPIYMRADMTDMPGYWNAVIDSPPDEGTTSVRKKRDMNFHQPRGYQPRAMEKRWFGSFSAWLAKLNTLATSDSIHGPLSCPNFQSSLDISVSGYAAVNTQFGYYLEATIVPPAVQQAYVYFKAGAGAEAAFTITGVASASWTSGRYELIEFGFPGEHVFLVLSTEFNPNSSRIVLPWLAEPWSLCASFILSRKCWFEFSQLHLYGELSGQISLSGSLKTSVSYTFPNLDLSFGKQDSNPGQNSFGSVVAPTNHNGGANYAFGWNVELSGSADAHLIPSLQLGVSVLGGTLINAQIFVEADLYAGVALTGSVSHAISSNICIGPEIGVSLNAGLTGSVLYWQTGPLSKTFYSAQSNWTPTCLPSVTEPVEGSNRKRLSLLEAPENITPVISGSFETGERRPFEPRKSAPQPAYAVYDGRTVYPTSRWERGLPGTSSSESGLNSRDVPFLPGSLFCPATDSEITSTITNCDPYAGDATPLSRRDILDERLLIRGEYSIPAVNETKARANLSEEEAVRHLLAQRAEALGTLMTCPTFTIPIPPYASIPLNAYYDLANPASLDGSIRGYANAPPYYTKVSGGRPSLGGATNGVAVYGREHVYEQSMSSRFIDYLFQFPEVWTDGSGDDFCHWIDNNLWKVPAYMPTGSSPVADQIGLCYPSLANSRAVGIPALEQLANVYKQRAFYVTQQLLDPGVLTKVSLIVDTDNFDKECPTNQIATLRSLAMITPFMNSLPARDAFMQTNNCIRGVYQTWYTAYKANAAVNTVPSAAEFISEYNAWVKRIVQGIQPAITARMATLIPDYNDGDTTAVNVKLSTNAVLSTWSKLSPSVPAGTAWTPTNNLNTAMSNANLISIQSVAAADLQALKNSVPAISWAANLP
ncbi:hypothetical protein C8R45DRAFT_1214705 [Mycena sanguinolenta]|nr:hypothetical protein C8R45DRAFT_1214705 [Mycena sanguinolenta]